MGGGVLGHPGCVPSLTLDHRQRRLVLALVAVGSLVLLAVLAVVVTQRPGVGPGGAGSAPTPAASSAEEAAAAGVDTTEEATYAEATPADPDRLRIPELGVDAPVRGIEAPGRVLVPPRDPQQLGWWSDGARPGAETGSALVVGHTVHTGGGALDDLETLRTGDRMTVRSDGADLVYAVSTVRVYDKGRIARDAGRLFSQEVPGRLVVLTCEDWDGAGYRSNVVVVAEPVDRPA